MILRRGYEFTTGYRLQEYLGKGQFGEVWRASGPGGVVLAAKFVGLEGGRGQKEYEAIRRVKSIRHANLMPITAIWQLDEEGNLIEDPPEDVQQTVDLFDVDSRGQSGFVVTPGPQPSTLIVGMTLGDASLEKFLPKDKHAPDARERIPTGELLKYMEGTARGLDFLNSPNHDFGSGPVSLQHCDVKPANIVLVGDSAVICDFGLARILAKNQITMTNPSGTPAYMSPEAIDGKPSKTSDQYSLAVTYYHLRTGTLPLNDSESVHQVLRAHISGTLDFGRLPVVEQKVLRRATDMDWQQRYESNSHFVAAIRNALNEQGIDTSGQASHSSIPARPESRRPVPGPSGPAAQGVESYDEENLTGGVIEHSKGGTPILNGNGSNVQSHETWMPGDKTGAVAAAGAAASQDIQPAFETSDVRVAEANGPKQALVSVPDALQLRAASTDDAKPARTTPSKWWTPPLIAAASVVLAATLAGGVWITRPGDAPSVPAGNGDASSNSGEETIAADSFAKAMGMIDGDLTAAKKNLESAVAVDPSLLSVAYQIQPAHADLVEKMVSLANSSHFLTTGFDRTPKWWTVQTGPTSEPNPADLVTRKAEKLLQSDVIAEMEDAVRYRSAVQISLDENWLFIGAGETVAAWPITKLQSANPESFPVAPIRRWNVDGTVVAVAIHPKQTNLAIVATEDQRLRVVDATSSARSREPDAETRIADIPKDLRFIAGGEMLLIQYEYGDLVAMRWSDLRSNQISERSAPTESMGVNDCQVLDPSNVSLGNQFWVGHASGVVSEHRVTDVTIGEIQQTIVLDSIAQSSINAMSIGRDQAGESSILLTGSGDSSIAITTLSAPPKSDVARLSGGPVRCVALSDDQRWYVAGVDGAVWVGSVDQPGKWKAKLSIGNVTAESIRIDATNDLLIVGCGDGSLATMNWTHARLRSLIDSSPEAPTAPVPGTENLPGRAI